MRISWRSGTRQTTPTTVEARPSRTSKITELATVRRTWVSSPAPRNCATRVVVAMVNPATVATRIMVMGKLTETAPRASAPKYRPTQKLSTVL